MKTWQLQEAKAKLSELMDAVESSGPQTITRRGVERAVVVSIEEWKSLHAPKKRSLLDVLQSGPQYDLQIPPRGSWKMRKPVKL